MSRRGALASLLRGALGNAVVDSGASRAGGRRSRSQPAGGADDVLPRAAAAGQAPQRRPLSDRSDRPRLPGLLTSSGNAPHGPDRDLRCRPLRARPPPRRPADHPLAPLLGSARLPAGSFNHRLTHAHDSRTGGVLVLVGPDGRARAARARDGGSRALGRAAFLAAPSCLVVSLILSAFGVTGPDRGSSSRLAARVGRARPRGRLRCCPRGSRWRWGWPRCSFLFAVMWAEAEWNSLGALGARAGRRRSLLRGQQPGRDDACSRPRSCSARSWGDRGLAVGRAGSLAGGIGVSSVGANGSGLVPTSRGSSRSAGSCETRRAAARVAVGGAVAVGRRLRAGRARCRGRRIESRHPRGRRRAGDAGGRARPSPAPRRRQVGSGHWNACAPVRPEHCRARLARVAGAPASPLLDALLVGARGDRCSSATRRSRSPGWASARRSFLRAWLERRGERLGPAD